MEGSRNVASQGDDLKFQINSPIALFLLGDAVKPPDEAVAPGRRHQMLGGAAVVLDFRYLRRGGNGISPVRVDCEILRPAARFHGRVNKKNAALPDHRKRPVRGAAGEQLGFGDNRFMDVLLAIVIVNDGQQTLEGSVGNESRPDPVVDKTGWDAHRPVIENRRHHNFATSHVASPITRFIDPQDSRLLRRRMQGDAAHPMVVLCDRP